MTTTDIQAQIAPRSFGEGFMRGLGGRCPNCGEGHLFSGYLKVQPRCEACGHDLSVYRADDGPAYFTILIVGHLIVAPLLCFSFIWTWNPILVLALTLPPILAATLILLPRVKGAFIGGQWANGATPHA
jgi:uncharacterized protein (DUF983 family)